MRKYISIQKLLAFALLAVSFASCSEDTMDGVNENKNNAKDVQAKFILADVMVSTGFNTVGGDLSLYSSIYMEHEAGIYNQPYNAETRVGEPTSSTTYNNPWGLTYQNVKNAKIAIQKCSKGGPEAGNDITRGIANVLLSYNIAVLTDMFGDVPFTESGLLNVDGTPAVMQPKIDTQESIYKSIVSKLDSALILLDGKDAGVYGKMGAKDFIYGGNVAKWKKAVYALKARYAMRLLNKSTDKTGDLNKILDYVSKSFTSADDEFKLAIYDGNTNVNPLYGFSSSRDGLGASKSLIDKFVVRNDPRARESFMYWVLPSYDLIQRTDPAKLFSVENGKPEQQQYYYDLSISNYAATAPTMLLSYHELLFLKAEALCRLSRKGEAEDVLKEAIEAAFVNQANTINSTIDNMGADASTDLDQPAVADAYFTNSVKPLFEANPLKETMIQKYLAFFGASGESVEAYNDYRRMKAAGENFVELKNANNATQFPLRFGYGSDDVIANKAIKAAFGDGTYVYKENVWWAGSAK